VFVWGEYVAEIYPVFLSTSAGRSRASLQASLPTPFLPFSLPPSLLPSAPTAFMSLASSDASSSRFAFFFRTIFPSTISSSTMST